MTKKATKKNQTKKNKKATKTQKPATVQKQTKPTATKKSVNKSAAKKTTSSKPAPKKNASKPVTKKQPATNKTATTQKPADKPVTQKDLDKGMQNFLAVKSQLPSGDARNIAFKKPMKFYREHGVDEAVALLKKEAQAKQTTSINNKPNPQAHTGMSITIVVKHSPI